jgi:hypothetical protein
VNDRPCYPKPPGGYTKYIDAATINISCPGA